MEAERSSQIKSLNNKIKIMIKHLNKAFKMFFYFFFKPVKRLTEVIKYLLVLILIDIIVIFNKHYIKLYQLN